MLKNSQRTFSMFKHASNLDALCCLNISWNTVMDEQTDNMNEWMNKYLDSNFPISTEFSSVCKLRFLSF